MVFVDSSFVIDYLRGRENARKMYRSLMEESEQIMISSIALMELITGAYLSGRTKDEIDKIKKFLTFAAISDFTEECAFEAGKIEAELSKNGSIIDSEDSMIASSALLANEFLVTRNIHHFEKIRGLKIRSY
ncbi:PIN domain-containing protein [Candidatus Pacearchaeota archaeon]|nr:PIN domain-containing protein [Candidatus Pacearchaeota archaeon]